MEDRLVGVQECNLFLLFSSSFPEKIQLLRDEASERQEEAAEMLPSQRSTSAVIAVSSLTHAMLLVVRGGQR